MSKDLIERLLDNRVTGFNLTVAAVEAADLIEAQAAQIVMLVNLLKEVAISTSDHTTTDVIDEYLALYTTPDEALQAFYERVKEQCAQVIEDWDSDSIDPREAAEAIRNLKELPK